MHYASEIVVLSPHLASTLAFISSALGSVNAQVVRRCVDYILSLLGHDSLSSSVSAEATQQATAIRTAVQTTGFNWVSAMLNGMITDYEDTATCVTAFRQLGDQFPGELAQWVPAALQQVSPKALVPSEREAFSAQFNQAITARDLSQIRASFMALDRMSRKSKRRQWEEGRFCPLLLENVLTPFQRSGETKDGHARFRSDLNLSSRVHALLTVFLFSACTIRSKV